MKKRILTIFSVYLAVIACCFAGRDSISLDGIWRFEMDPDKQGRIIESSGKVLAEIPATVEKIQE